MNDTRYRLYHAVCLLALPFVQLAINRNLFVNPGENITIDPWVYTGFFLDLPDYLHRFAGTYYGTRLPWLLPGFAAHTLFSPLVANDVLHLAFFYGLLFATYGLVSSGVNRSVAMLVTLLVAWNPAILAALSWDYIDGAGIVFMIAALCGMERAMSPRAGHPLWWSAAAGASIACMVGSNLTLVALCPACGIFLLLRGGISRWRLIAASAAAMTLSAVATLAVLGAANRALGGSWLFLEPSVRLALSMSGTANQWEAAGVAWVSRATWLAVPAFAAAGAVLSLAFRPRRQAAFGRAVQVTFLAALGVWLLLDSGRSALLQFSYYTSYLTALALVALPLQAGVPPADRTLRSAVAVELATIGVFAAAHLAFYAHLRGFWLTVTTELAHEPAVTVPIVATLVCVAAGCAGVIALRLVPIPRLAWAGFLTGMVVGFSAVTVFWPGAGSPNYRDDLEQTALAHRFIAANVTQKAMRFWYAPPNNVSPPFRSISSTFLWGYVLINEEFPHITDATAKTIQPGSRLVLLMRQESEAQQARAALRPFGLDFTVVGQKAFGTPDRPFIVQVRAARVVRANNQSIPLMVSWSKHEQERSSSDRVPPARAVILPPSLKLRRTAVAQSAEAGRQAQEERRVEGLRTSGLLNRRTHHPCCVRRQMAIV